MPIVQSGTLIRDGKRVHNSQVSIEQIEDAELARVEIAILSLPHDGSFTPDALPYELRLKSGAVHTVKFLREEAEPLGLRGRKAVFLVMKGSASSE